MVESPTEAKIVNELTTAQASLEAAVGLMQLHYPYAAAIIRSALGLVRTELKFFVQRRGQEDGSGRVEQMSDVRKPAVVSDR